MGNIVVFDTETTSVDTKKAFCYDIGYEIIDASNWTILCQRHFVIEQIWHNLPLFQSAYYADKRPLYVGLMRSKKAELTKWGYACQQMKRDFKNYEVTQAYAFNCRFDDEVFETNCNWFHCINPFDTIPIYDIWGYSSQYITNQLDYRNWCEQNNKFNDSGNYSGSAETVYSYIIQDPTYEEQHMGLPDSCIEAEILRECIQRGASVGQNYPVNKVLKSNRAKPFIVKVDGNIVVNDAYISKYISNDKGLYSFNTK